MFVQQCRSDRTDSASSLRHWFDFLRSAGELRDVGLLKLIQMGSEV